MNPEQRPTILYTNTRGTQQGWKQIHLMERIPPHVAAGQRLVEGEHHGVVLGVRFVASLSDPAPVARQRVMEAPGAAGVAR